MTNQEILTKALSVIRDPKCWTQGTFARTSNMESARPTDKEAVCFCSLGAIENVTNVSVSAYRVSHPLVLLAEAMGMKRQAHETEMMYASRAFDHVYKFNDSNNHASVVEAFELAIQKAKEQNEHEPQNI